MQDNHVSRLSNILMNCILGIGMSIIHYIMSLSFIHRTHLTIRF